MGRRLGGPADGVRRTVRERAARHVAAADHGDTAGHLQFDSGAGHDVGDSGDHDHGTPGELADFAAFPEGLNPVGVRAALGPALVDTCWDGLQEA